MTRVRWVVLALLFFATTINYLDRIVFTVLIPVIRQELHINDQQYGYVNGAFQFAYMLGYLLMGKLTDRFGTRIGYAISVIGWSLAAAGHVLSRGAFALTFWRSMLGIWEGGNFPAAIRTVAEWFPRKDRAFATGIFNAGTNVASMIGPPLFAWMVFRTGWRACFLVTAASGFVWLAIWWLWYRVPAEHRSANAAERAYVTSDGPEEAAAPAISWREAFRHRQTWGFALGKFFSDPVWWFYLFWLPPYFYDVRHMNLTQIGWALPFIYLMADVGSVAGGWMSSWLIRRGWRTGTARKATMAFFACCMPIGAMSVLADSPVIAIGLISLATSAHQGWSCNIFTTTSDVFPRSAVATVTGIGGAAGSLGGFLFSSLIPGYIVTHFGYTPVFLVLGCFHLIALLCVHLLMGRMDPLPAPVLATGSPALRR